MAGKNVDVAPTLKTGWISSPVFEIISRVTNFVGNEVPVMKINFRLICAASLLVMSAISFAALKPEELVKRYDEVRYDPVFAGMKDMVLEARVDGMTKQLNDKQIYGKVTDVHYKIYWIPGKTIIEIQNMPKGFEETRRGLESMIMPFVDVIIPKMLSPMLKGYELKVGDTALVVKAEDPTHSREVDQMIFVFGEKGDLKEAITMRPAASESINQVMSTKPWSKNKLVVDKIESEVKSAGGAVKTVSTIEYKEAMGFGLPSQITVEVGPVPPNSVNPKILPKGTSTKISFSGAKVNTGVAAKKVEEYLKRAQERQASSKGQTVAPVNNPAAPKKIR
jgi:hypothetical protein